MALQTKTISRYVLMAAFVLALRAEAGQGGTVALKMKFRPGDVSKYQTTAQSTTLLTMPGQPNPLTTTTEVNLVQQWQVTKSTPAGGGEVAATTLSGQIRRNGKAADDSPVTNTPIYTTFDAQGNVLAIKGAAANTNGGLFSVILGSGALNLQRTYLPPKPVKPGETWTQKVQMQGLPVGTTGTAKATFLRTEPVGRYQTARIRSTLTIPLKAMMTEAFLPTSDVKQATSVVSGTLTLNFDSNFAIAEGKVVRSAGSGGALLTLRPGGLAKKAKPSPSAAKPVQIMLKMQVGNNLME